MNSQGNAYPNYPPPSQAQYQFPANPYPTSHQHQHQLPFQYPTPPQPQHSQQQQAQYFRQAAQSAPQQQQQQHQHQQAQAQPVPQQQQQPQLSPPSRQISQAQPAARSQPQRRRQRPAKTTPLPHQNAVPPALLPPSNVPPAPTQPESNSPELEEQLMSALQRDQQTDNEHNDNDEDDEDDGDENDGDAGSNEPVFQLPPPPEGNYPNQEELEKSIHAWSLEHGYEVVRRASKKNANGVLYKRYFHCSKHGKLANTGKLTEQTRVRMRRKSGRTGCPMSLAAVAVDPSNPDGDWQIRHRKTHHNHGPLDALALAGHRRRARMGGVEKAVDGLFAIGTPTTQVLQFLQRTNPGGLFTRTDVANMKLKHKKYGTCVKEPGQYSKESNGGINSVSGGHGVPSACLSCRAKKIKCDSVRPMCGTCTQNNRTTCEYDHEPGSAHRNRPNPARQPQQQTPTENDQRQTPLSTQRAAAEQILADLQSFQADHVRLKKLDLSSSSVEILAQSSCGSGASYSAVKVLGINADWPEYSAAFMEASLKENTQDVLSGMKAEPIQPTTSDGGELDIEEWNEYVKQLAIYQRRNSMLLGFLFSTLAPTFRSRVQTYKRASEAWKALEELCSPRGSDQAFRLFNELHTITYQGCGGRLDEYIRSLEATYNNLTRLKLSQHVTNGRPRLDVAPASRHVSNAATGADVFTEYSLCFLFLRNLGEGKWRKWVDTLCSTNNVGGFGTGVKLGFREVSKRAMEWERGGNVN